ncbi:MAG: hypothetical protein AB7U41_00830 [Dongiaceae bacterium]
MKSSQLALKVAFLVLFSFLIIAPASAEPPVVAGDRTIPGRIIDGIVHYGDACLGVINNDDPRIIRGIVGVFGAIFCS